MAMIIDNKYEFGQTVYLKTDPDQLPRIVTRFQVTPMGVFYGLCSGTNDTWHYEMEISDEINAVLKTE